MTQPPLPLQHGVSVILAALKGLPALPGVYRMLDTHGTILYIGKAKNLPKRVINYTRPQVLAYRIQRMISQTASLEYTVTQTETEALLLESTLIKRHEPKYNILLKDDKSFPYIAISMQHDFPRIYKHRGTRQTGHRYFGPYPSANAVTKAIGDIQKAFLIRPCTDRYLEQRTRPCMQYQIKRCSAPCVDRITKKDYHELLNQALMQLQGKSRHLQHDLTREMEEASVAMNYEKAAILRDRITALNQIQSHQNSSVQSVSDADVIAYQEIDGLHGMAVTVYRAGQLLGHRSFFPRHTSDATPEEIMGAFVGQYYQTNTPPKEILLSHGIHQSDDEENTSDTDAASTLEHLCTLLSDIAGEKVSLFIPQRGARKTLIQATLTHLSHAVKEKQASSLKQTEILEGVAKVFDLAAAPKRIEVFDNSHLMGTFDVGGMIVATDEGFLKKAYRRFNIQGEASHSGDDYAMMEQVLTRRYRRLLQEHPTYQSGIWPDLILIDGGPGHRSVAIKVFDELGLLIPFACIAKGPDRNAGREDFYMKNKDPFTLQKDDPVMHYLQVLRDEAHNYAIGSHRSSRGKALTYSRLDDVPGIGAKRKKQLLIHFGSADGVKHASIEELREVEGINNTMADQIYQFFH